jgi:ribosomal protein S21
MPTKKITGKPKKKGAVTLFEQMEERNKTKAISEKRKQERLIPYPNCPKNTLIGVREGESDEQAIKRYEKHRSKQLFW